jgi:hypothetical protein
VLCAALTVTDDEVATAVRIFGEAVAHVADEAHDEVRAVGAAGAMTAVEARG